MRRAVLAHAGLGLGVANDLISDLKAGGQAELDGLLSVGASVADALYVMHYLNRACEIQLAATGGGQRCSEIPAHLSQHACEQLQGAEWQRQLIWQAWLRKIDRLDPSYRD